jgi:hypothetical protein
VKNNTPPHNSSAQGSLAALDQYHEPAYSEGPHQLTAARVRNRPTPEKYSKKASAKPKRSDGSRRREGVEQYARTLRAALITSQITGREEEDRLKACAASLALSHNTFGRYSFFPHCTAASTLRGRTENQGGIRHIHWWSEDSGNTGIVRGSAVG